MKAVVLAAGEGRRLRPLTVNRGKGMLPVANRPVLSYVIENLASCNVRDIVMVVGYKKEKVMNHFGDGKDLGVSIEYVHQKFQLGTAHALFQAKDALDGRFLVIPGDSMIDQGAIESLLRTPKNEWGIVAAKNPTSAKYGVIEAHGEKLVSIKERPKLTDDLISSGTPSIFALALWEYQDPVGSALINTGTYVLDRSVFRSLERKDLGEPLTLTSCISEEAVKRNVRVIHGTKWLDAVYPWDLLALNEHVLSGNGRDLQGTVEEGVVVRGNVRIGANARIMANSVLEGPIVIGGGATIGPNAYIGPNTSIGENCTIGPFSVIKDSLIMDDVLVGAHSSVHKTIMDQGSSIGDFFAVEQGEYTIKLERFTAKKTLGAVVGSDCEVSHHVCLGTGVILGNGCRVGPMRALRDNLPDGSIAV